MEENKEPLPEEKLEEVKAEEVVEEVKEEEAPKDDRPERNWRAEAERKSRELEKARLELEAEKARQVHRYDPNDLNTWGENDLKAIANSLDPAHLRFKEQAQDILLERKLQRIRSQELAKEKRVKSELELRKQYPDALDPSSEFSARMEEMMLEYDLDKSPAGRLAAARLVDGELNGAKRKETARGRKTEEDRVRAVKASFSEGDRPKAESITKSEAQKNLEALAAKGDEDAMLELIKQRLHKK